jgi:hypothetical protein
VSRRGADTDRAAAPFLRKSLAPLVTPDYLKAIMTMPFTNAVKRSATKNRCAFLGKR